MDLAIGHAAGSEARRTGHKCAVICSNHLHLSNATCVPEAGISSDPVAQSSDQTLPNVGHT